MVAKSVALSSEFTNPSYSILVQYKNCETLYTLQERRLSTWYLLSISILSLGGVPKLRVPLIFCQSSSMGLGSLGLPTISFANDYMYFYRVSKKKLLGYFVTFFYFSGPFSPKEKVLYLYSTVSSNICPLSSLNS